MDNRRAMRGEIKPQVVRGEKKQSLTIEDREKMVLTGVLNVESFNETEIVLETELGMLVIKGTTLHMSKLNLESGDLCVDGGINSCVYSEKQDLKTKSAGILSKLFK